jgi:hypothetical protein
MLPGYLKNKIIDSFATQSKESELELEARYGFFTKRGFKPGINRQTFNRIKAYFDKQTKALHEVSTDYIMGDVRKSVFIDKTLWITKNKLWKEDVKEYPLRYSMSREKSISPISDDIFTPELIRTKNRSSYFIFDDSVRVDITLVSTKSERDNYINHEVEIELLDPSKIDKFELAVKIILRLVLDTYEFYTENERQDVIQKVNSTLGSIERKYIDNYPLVQARNLKLRDMVGGGLIGNPETNYTVTHKTDGQRKMLAFLNSGIWLLSSTSINRVSRNYVKLLEGTILDGEMVEFENRIMSNGAPKTKIWYLVFDVLSEDGDISIQKKPHLERMNFAQKRVVDFWKTLKLDIMKINTKTFRGFKTPVEFFTLMREMYREQPLLAYKQDGFMFTPTNTEYNPHSDKNKLSERVLTKYPDICKWKEKDELTIDFLIRWIKDNKIDLYVNQQGKPVLFKGSFFQPLSEIDYLNPLTIDLPNDTIVEYGYDYERKMLVPRRVRHDKTKPNRQDVAEDVWSDIHDPIEEETMKGNTFALLRKYHNRIKKNLFEKSLEGKSGFKTLLDIGSGYGGDLGKWRKFDKILAVEPDPEHIEEMKKRLKTYDMENKVKILQAGGEETDKIRSALDEWLGKNEKVDVVSSMLSLTFFWQNETLVDSLVKTITTNIKPDGKYIFLTMDGDLVEQAFDPVFNTGFVLNKLELGPATLVYKEDKKELYINIKGTIVEEQREWLVRLDDLKIRFGKDFDMLEKADKELFLTEEEQIMTRMYTYGMISNLKELSKDEKKSPEKVQPPSLKSPLPSLKSPEKINETIKEKRPLPSLKSPETIKETIKEKSPLPSLKTSETIKGKTPLPSLKKSETIKGKTPLPSLKTPKTLPKITAKTPKTPKTPQKTKESKRLPMLPMDVVETIKITWWNEQGVRIGNIGDGSCFFHAILNAYLKAYQTNPSRKFREDFVKNLRKDIAAKLGEINIDDKTFYETIADGQLVTLYEQQLLGIDFKDVFEQKVDFSLEGLQKHIDSKNYLGDEIYSIASELIGIDVYIMRITEEDLYVHLNTHREGINKRSVVISGNGEHFETIGLERNGLYQTFFESDDPFILKIRSFSSV